MNLKVLLIGNRTVDENVVEGKRYKAAGGAVYFAAKTFENLGSDCFIVSPPKFDKPLIFRNIYKTGERIQTVENYRQYLYFDWLANIKQFPPKADVVMIAPVINNVTASQIVKIKTVYPGSFFCLLPQGLYRKIINGGEVRKSNWKFADKVISYFDFICFSEEDIKGGEKKARQWSKGGSLVVITRAQKGSSMYKDGQRTDTPAFSSQDLADPTGAGDIFAAAFIFHFFQTKNIDVSLGFAHRLAYLSLRKSGNKLQYV